MKKIYLLLIFSIIMGCEKDDICAADTPTTPQIVIEFLNDIQNAVSVPNSLKIRNTDDLKEVAVVTTSKIKLPLKTDNDITSYSLTVNSDVTAAANIDKISFDCNRKSVYISRACGYKTLFTLKTNDAILIPETPTNNWIKRIVVTKQNILNEDETHVKIYF